MEQHSPWACMRCKSDKLSQLCDIHGPWCGTCYESCPECKAQSGAFSIVDKHMPQITSSTDRFCTWKLILCVESTDKIWKHEEIVFQALCGANAKIQEALQTLGSALAQGMREGLTEACEELGWKIEPLKGQ